MTQEEAVSSICADARLSTKGQHADYIRCILSQLVAAEHRRREAELADETPIDEAWADSISSRQQSEGDNAWVLGIADVGSSVVLLHRHNTYGDFWALYMCGMKIQMIATRGQLCEVCAALGIPLRQAADELAATKPAT